MLFEKSDDPLNGRLPQGQSHTRATSGCSDLSSSGQKTTIRSHSHEPKKTHISAGMGLLFCGHLDTRKSAFMMKSQNKTDREMLIPSKPIAATRNRSRANLKSLMGGIVRP